MKAIYAKYGIELSLTENQIITLVVENPQVLSDMLRDIFRQINGEEGSNLNSNIVTFLENLLTTVPYHLEMEVDLDVAALLKLYGVKVETDGVDVLETLIDYLRAVSSICNIHVVWMLNLKQFLTEEEVGQLYEFCFYEKIHLINLEGQKSYTLEQEKCVIIDRDLCVIDTSLN